MAVKCVEQDTAHQLFKDTLHVGLKSVYMWRAKNRLRPNNRNSVALGGSTSPAGCHQFEASGRRALGWWCVPPWHSAVVQEPPRLPTCSQTWCYTKPETLFRFWRLRTEPPCHFSSFRQQNLLSEPITRWHWPVPRERTFHWCDIHIFMWIATLSTPSHQLCSSALWSEGPLLGDRCTCRMCE